MATPRRSSQNLSDPLIKWLNLNWDRPERSYNPNVRDFLADLLDYPKEQVITEDATAGGYPDIKLLTDEKIAWVVGDLKKDDAELTTLKGRKNLWQQKRKYVEGLTRYVLFLTPHYLWIVLPTGEALANFGEPLNLSEITLTNLKLKLKFLSHEQANHLSQWATFIEGEFPYIYLKLDELPILNQLQRDLQSSFGELNEAAEKAIQKLLLQYEEYERQKQEINRNLVDTGEAKNRALMRLGNKYNFERFLFNEILPQFEDQYGREVTAQSNKQAQERIREAFISDSVAVLIARVLFLRLLEDLGLGKKRRLSNGGPKDWAAFVDHLTGDARALVQLISEDVGRLYQDPFEQNLFDWIYRANGMLDEALQRLILRFNAYDFSGLSEEILGDIYQSFLPTAKRKRLGEFYTPASIVDWLLDQTIFSHEPDKILDPACGSGSFLVRYVHRVLDDAKKRGLESDDIFKELQDNVWGFDLNPFAAFISHFQLTWALLRYKQQTMPPTIHVYNLNSVLKDADLVSLLGEQYLSPGSVERDSEKWKYIVGNPPYIRAERVKYSDEMRGLWQQIWGQNADTGLVFLYRALTESLEEDGFLGMVVSGGYANSEAAAKVWKLLYPGRGAALRKLVWLEFAGKLWDASVIPMLLIIEKVPAKENDEIELLVPSSWPTKEKPTKIKYKDFFDAKVTPRVTAIDPSNTSEGLWGDYLLPLLHRKDIAILKKLYPNDNSGKKSNIVSLKNAVAQLVNINGKPYFTYGIQLGRGANLMPNQTEDSDLEILSGYKIAMGFHDEAEGWVNLQEVQKRSIWRDKKHHSFIAISELALAPFACVVEGENIAARNSVIVGLPKQNGISIKTIACFLNSKLVRFYYLIRLRTGVLEGSSRAHIYPRTLEALPWVKNLDLNLEQQLTNNYNELARLAAIAKNNPEEWLLSEVENRIQQKRYKLSDRHLELTFINWNPDDVTVAELSLDHQFIRAGLFWFALVDGDLAELVFKLLTLNLEDDSKISRGTIQKLLVPQDYQILMQDYRQRSVSFQQVELDFFAVLAQIDEAVYTMFNLTEEEKAHIEQRLSSFPLNKLQPRYPWQTVKPRPIKAYTEDRFT